jgi:hypothetical protein
MSRAGRVVVLGAGPAGIAAALAAARLGAHVTLVERHGFLGGNMTLGLCMHTFQNKLGQRVIEGIPAEFVRRLQAVGASPGSVPIRNAHMYSTTPVDVEMVKLVATAMLAEAGVEIRVLSPVSAVGRRGATLESIQVPVKDGLGDLSGDVFVDATGDGEVAARAGAPVEMGRPGDGRVQPASVVFTVEHVDLAPALRRAGKGLAESVTPCSDGRTIPVWFAMTTTPWNDLIEAKGYFLGRDREFWGNSIRPGVFNLNVTRVAVGDPTDPVQYSAGLREGLRQVEQMLDFLSGHVPGFEQARLLRIGPFLGLRESRRVTGDYLLSEDDVLAGTLFPDRIALGGYPIDIHDVTGGPAIAFRGIQGGGTYSIPYRSLLPRGVSNLLLAGRCMSTTHGAHGGTRVMVTSMAVGEAAGTAAALAASRGVPPRELSVADLQHQLRAQGAKLDP